MKEKLIQLVINHYCYQMVKWLGFKITGVSYIRKGYIFQQDYFLLKYCRPKNNSNTNFKINLLCERRIFQSSLIYLNHKVHKILIKINYVVVYMSKLYIQLLFEAERLNP